MENFNQKFEDVFGRNRDRVCQYVTSIIHNGMVAEDITAEVFFTLWKKKDSLLKYKNVDGLLFKISKDLSINYLKSLAKDQKKKQDFVYFYFNQSSENNEQTLTETQLSSLEQAIDELPRKCRKVVKMKFIEGSSLKQIASKLHISVNTVQNHLAKGKVLIKESMTNDEAFWVLVVVSLFL